MGTDLNGTGLSGDSQGGAGYGPMPLRIGQSRGIASPAFSVLKGPFIKGRHRVPGLVRMPSAVLQGRIMHGSAADILANPIPLPSRSRMKRPCRTPDTRRDDPALRAGLL
jgi:hypothetical protein